MWRKEEFTSLSDSLSWPSIFCLWPPLFSGLQIQKSLHHCFPGSPACRRQIVGLFHLYNCMKKFLITGVLNLPDLMPDAPRWSWCNNNRNRVYNKQCAWIIGNHSCPPPWKNCLPRSQSLELGRLGTTAYTKSLRMCILLGLFLWRTLTNTLSLLSHCSNCPRLRPRKLLQVDSSGSLFSVTRWYSRFMMYYLCTSPEMSHFSKELWSLFTEEWNLRTKNWASAVLIVTGVLLSPGPLSG